MIKILFICRHFLPEKSGMATQMYNHIQFLRKNKNFNIKLVHLTENLSNNQHPYVSETIPFKYGLRDELLRLKDSFKPDIIHFDSIWPAGRCISQVFKDKPKAISVGGRLFDEYKDYHKYTKSNFFIGKLKGIFLYQLAKHVLNGIDIVFAEGDDIKQHLMNHGVQTKIFAINNGMDYSRFNYKRNKGKTVLFFGRYSWENGPDQFLEILKGLPNFKGTMVGYGPMKEELEFAALKIPNVKVLGPVNFEEVPNLLDSFDFVLLPLRRIGGISQTVTEAMAAGKVVLTTRIGDLENAIEHSKTGFFFKDIPDARNILHSVAENLKLRRTIEKSAIQKIRKEFAWSTVIEKYLQIYKNYFE